MKRNRTPSMRKFALSTARATGDTGLDIVNAEAKRRGERLYPKATWDSLVKQEVPRWKKYGDDFFNKHTDNPFSWGDLKKGWPL
jgi:hypothetical protein